MTKTKVGLIGLGFIGRMHLATLRRGGLAELTAVADKEPENLAGRGAAGNLEVSGDTSLDGVATYATGEALLAEADVDAVILAVPTYLHKDLAIAAIKAGKHALCEKPLALSGEEGRAICEATKGSDRAFMVGHCLRFWPAYMKAAEFVRQGTYGAVRHAHFIRTSPKPAWAWQGWLMDERLSGGAILDLHVHDVDFVNYLFGRPKSIEAVGVRNGKEGIEQANALYQYADGPVVTIEGGWGHPAPYPFRMGFRIVCEKATLVFESSVDMNLRVYDANGATEALDSCEGDGYAGEQAYFLDCIARGEAPTNGTAASSTEALELVDWERAVIAERGM